MTNGRERSDLAIVATKPANNDGRPSAAGPHAPDAGPGKRVPGTGPRTARCTDTEEGTVHRAPPPRLPRPATDGFLRPQVRGCSRRRRADVADLRGRPRSPDRELARAGPPGSVPGAARPPRVHPQGGRQPASARHRGAGGQDRPKSRGDGAERDLRGGLPRVLVRVPARARGARRARGRDHPHQGEPHLGRRHPVVLRSCILLPSSRTQFCAERDLIQLASPQPPQLVQGAGRVGEQV